MPRATRLSPQNPRSTAAGSRYRARSIWRGRKSLASGVARDQAAILAYQRRRRPAPLLDACRDRGNLGIRVGPSIFRVRDQPVDRPPLDLVGRPRPLISRRLSRVRARAPRDGGSVGAMMATFMAAMESSIVATA